MRPQEQAKLSDTAAERDSQHAGRRWAPRREAGRESPANVLVRQSDLSVVWTRCGERMTLALPVAIDVGVAAANTFGALHEARAEHDAEQENEGDINASRPRP